MTDPFPGAIRLVPSPGHAGLSPSQRTFNALTRQVAARRERLRAWEAVWPAFQQRYVDQWVPLAREASAHEAELVRRLDVAFDMKGLTRAERALVSELIVHFVRPLLDGADDGGGLREIHARHRPTGRVPDAGGAAPTPRVRGRAGDAAGGAPSPSADAVSGMSADAAAPASGTESDDEMMRRIQAELDAQEARAAAAAEARDAGRSERNERKRASKRRASAPPDEASPAGDDADASEAERAAADAVPDLPPVQISRSLRELYRRLASALHPDREPDPDQRARKTELMQQLNRAYDKQDLLQLLELERDLNSTDTDRLAGAGDDLLQHYNGMLKAQLGTLDRELHRVEADFRHGYGIGATASLAPDTVLRTLGGEIAALRRALAELERDLLAFRDVGTLKDWLRGFEG